MKFFGVCLVVLTPWEKRKGEMREWACVCACVCCAAWLQKSICTCLLFSCSSKLHVSGVLVLHISSWAWVSRFQFILRVKLK